MFALVCACGLDDPLPPPPPNSAPPVTSGNSEADSESGSSDGGTGETSETACDPLDPAACPPDLACNLIDLVCTEEGDGAVGDPCEDHADCRGGLGCHEGTCKPLCSPVLSGADDCPSGQVCAYAEAPLPGVCLTTCNLVLDNNCTAPGESCKRGLGPGPEVVAVCVDNPGAGVEGDACERDGDCSPAYLCTLAELHSLPCAGDAAACCTPMCDVLELPCFGLEPSCYPLGVVGQDSVGYCGI